MTPRDEWAQDALNDKDDQAGWEATRNEALGLDVGFVSEAEQIATWAAERAPVMADCPSETEWRRGSLLRREDDAA